MLAGFGPPEQHAAVVAAAAAAAPLFEFATPIPYAGLQQMLDEAAPWGIRAYEKALYLDELTDDAIDVFADRAAHKTSPMSFAPIFRLAGAYAGSTTTPPPSAGTGVALYVVNIGAIAPEPDALAADRAWVATCGRRCARSRATAAAMSTSWPIPTTTASGPPMARQVRTAGPDQGRSTTPATSSTTTPTSSPSDGKGTTGRFAHGGRAGRAGHTRAGVCDQPVMRAV